MKDKKTEQAIDPSEKRAPQSFHAASKDFLTLKSEVLKKSEKRAWLIVFIMSAIAALSIVATVFAVFFRVEPEPTVIEVEKSTGITKVMRKLSDTSDTYSNAIKKAKAFEYVRYRESYDWYTIATHAEAINLMSSPAIYRDYMSQINRSDSHLKQYKQGKRVLVELVGISFIGKLVQVRFTEQTVNSDGLNADTSPKVPYIATLALNFDSSIFMTPAERVINPLGMKVHSYEVSAEVVQ